MSVHRPIVLILASDPGFAREITAHWPQSPARSGSDDPEFVILDEGFSRSLQGSDYDLAIADASSVDKKTDNRKLPIKTLNKNLKQSLSTAGKPAIVIHSDPSRDFYNIHGAVIDLRREPGLWPAIAGLLGREILRRYQAEAHARAAAHSRDIAESEATLGRYMVEMRTNINNALTTVLGNAELLVHEPGLPASVQSQADAIRHMALRLHEVFQRFSSIEKELNVAHRESSKKAGHAASAGN
jgi:hypothetical protein